MSTVSGLDIANNVEREWRDRLKAAVLAEREACAKECENQKIGFPSYFEIDERIQELADAIRKRSNT